ncbi:MAG TPA: hypothetical protein DCP90_09430 [Clostridiales bacterium]|nr:MAG: hypothetical protein A2Y22_04770 [Clostridiales bacterium GWD2_32_59]HAN10813.1 hypothetical protein [Clostridiales bacterium]
MKPEIIAIASSTGGPSALRKICARLSEKIDVPIVIVQHMPKGFISSFAESLNVISRLRVKEAAEGEKLESGVVYIAPGGVHMIITSERNYKTVRMEESQALNGVKPAADRLFMSISDTYKGKNILAVVVTGMGKDGTIGVQYIKSNCNCYCITESKKTSVIYGMPKSVYEAGLSDMEVDLDKIADEINKIVVGWGS